MNGNQVIDAVTGNVALSQCRLANNRVGDAVVRGTSGEVLVMLQRTTFTRTTAAPPGLFSRNPITSTLLVNWRPQQPTVCSST